jgi:hypothetical protein
MAYYVFQVADQPVHGQERTAQEIFDLLVKEKNVWGFGPHTANRKAITAGDRVLFYLTGVQVFAGAATLKSGAYKDVTGENTKVLLDPESLRIDLTDVIVFPKPKPRVEFKSLEWRPLPGGSAKISEHDFLVVLGTKADVTSNPIPPVEEMEFALEKYLEDFIVENWEKIDFGEKLEIFEDDDGNKGKQYVAGDAGYIDILAKDKKNNLVVIELKKGQKSDAVVGQVLRYMGWVRTNLAKGADVRGLIVVRDRDPRLEYAVRELGEKVKVKRYSVSFRLMDY